MRADTALAQTKVSSRNDTAIVSSTLQKAERRNRPRRAADQNQATLAALAIWLANRQRQVIIVFDNRKRVLLINSAGKRLIEDTKAIDLSNGRLTFKTEKLRSAFERFVFDKTDSLMLPLKSTSDAISLSVSRLPLDSNGQLFVASAAMNAITDDDYDRLQAEFGLTRTEAEIAIGIFNGHSLVEIAAERELSVNTVKTQTRCVYQKCRVHSQVELSRKLADVCLAK